MNRVNFPRFFFLSFSLLTIIFRPRKLNERPLMRKFGNPHPTTTQGVGTHSLYNNHSGHCPIHLDNDPPTTQRVGMTRWVCF